MTVLAMVQPNQALTLLVASVLGSAKGPMCMIAACSNREGEEACSPLGIVATNQPQVKVPTHPPVAGIDLRAKRLCNKGFREILEDQGYIQTSWTSEEYREWLVKVAYTSNCLQGTLAFNETPKPLCIMVDHMLRTELDSREKREIIPNQDDNNLDSQPSGEGSGEMEAEEEEQSEEAEGKPSTSSSAEEASRIKEREKPSSSETTLPESAEDEEGEKGVAREENPSTRNPLAGLSEDSVPEQAATSPKPSLTSPKESTRSINLTQILGEGVFPTDHGPERARGKSGMDSKNQSKKRMRKGADKAVEKKPGEPGVGQTFKEIDPLEGDEGLLDAFHNVTKVGHSGEDPGQTTDAGGREAQEDGSRDQSPGNLPSPGVGVISMLDSGNLTITLLDEEMEWRQWIVNQLRLYNGTNETDVPYPLTRDEADLFHAFLELDENGTEVVSTWTLSTVLAVRNLLVRTKEERNRQELFGSLFAGSAVMTLIACLFLLAKHSRLCAIYTENRAHQLLVENQRKKREKQRKAEAGLAKELKRILSSDDCESTSETSRKASIVRQGYKSRPEKELCSPTCQPANGCEVCKYEGQYRETWKEHEIRVGVGGGTRDFREEYKPSRIPKRFSKLTGAVGKASAKTEISSPPRDQLYPRLRDLERGEVVDSSPPNYSEARRMRSFEPASIPAGATSAPETWGQEVLRPRVAPTEEDWEFIRVATEIERRPSVTGGS